MKTALSKVFRVLSLVLLPIALPLTGRGNTLNSPVDTTRPNILLIISDDQREDVMEYIPRIKTRIFDEGMTFTNAYATTPLCCPSRSSIFTGMYAHQHGVHTNSDYLLKKTFVDRLHDNGYYTGLVGKYLNSWDGSPRPEFDFWVSHYDGASRYYDPWLNVNGNWNLYSGYITFILRDYALEFIDHALQQEKPFLLIFAPNAPHASADPAPGDEMLYKNLAPHRPPNFNEDDVSDKPEWLRFLSPLVAKEITPIDTFRRNQLRCLHSLDQAVDSLLTTLAQQNKLDNTFVIYLSDNGYFWGEHRLRDKGHVYEEAIRVPFALRYPPLLQKPRTETRLVANIDIAPTIYELSGFSVPPEVDGRSLTSLLNTNTTWRTDLLVEGWPLAPRLPFAAVHTQNLVYVEIVGNQPEFYDLISDPYQLENQVNNPTHATNIAALKERLKQLQGNRTSVNDADHIVPQKFSLLQNYPNPFKLTTSLRFILPKHERTTLKIFDVLGNELMTLVDQELRPGEYTFIFNADALPNGMYWYRLATPSALQNKSMLIFK